MSTETPDQEPAMKATPQVDEIFLDEPWITIRWDGTRRCLMSEWKAFATTVEFRAALMKVIDTIRKKRVRGYLSDTRKLRLIVERDQKWAHDVWAPLAVEAGLKRLAFVIAESGLGKLTVEELVRMENDQRLLIHTFDAFGPARRWIEEAG